MAGSEREVSVFGASGNIPQTIQGVVLLNDVFIIHNVILKLRLSENDGLQARLIDYYR